jgi:pimeloyl-ACP methyl ester carboxylesterase
MSSTSEHLPPPEPRRVPIASGDACAATLYRQLTMDYSDMVVLYRPVRQAKRIGVPVLAHLGENDAIAPRRAIERSAARAPRGELRRYPVGHLGCFWPEHVDEIAGDQVEFLHRHLAAG